MTNIELTDDQRALLAELGSMGGKIGQSRVRQSFIVQVDRETPGLPEAERQARADELYRAYMRGTQFQPKRRVSA